MPAAIPVVLDHKTFASQNKARLHFSEMLHRYKVGQTVSDADKAELQSLLKLHPRHDPSIPIDRIAVTRTGFGRDCFAAVSREGPAQRLSFVHCIRQRTRPSKEELAPQPQQKIAGHAPDAPSAPAKKTPTSQAGGRK